MEKSHYLGETKELFHVLVIREESEEKAWEVMNEMTKAVNAGENPEDVLFSHGLEPDYVFDLL